MLDYRFRRILHILRFQRNIYIVTVSEPNGCFDGSRKFLFSKTRRILKFDAQVIGVDYASDMVRVQSAHERCDRIKSEKNDLKYSNRL